MPKQIKLPMLSLIASRQLMKISVVVYKAPSVPSPFTQFRLDIHDMICVGFDRKCRLIYCYLTGQPIRLPGYAVCSQQLTSRRSSSIRSRCMGIYSSLLQAEFARNTIGRRCACMYSSCSLGSASDRITLPTPMKNLRRLC